MIVYDLRYQPLSIGDFVDYMEVSQILGDPDIAYSYDKARPTIGDPGLSHINAANFEQYFAPFRTLCDKVVEAPAEQDWPPPAMRGRYMLYHLYNEIFAQGVKPLTFKSKPWAESFIKEHSIDCCVQLRRNPYPNNGKRNSDYRVWQRFFNRSKKRFVIIGEAHDTRMDNTVVAKDFNTTIEQDLALAAAAPVFMGPPSGPNSAVIFNRKPYRIFNAQIDPRRCTAFKVKGDTAKWAWAADNQVCTIGAPTTERILHEFESCLLH